MSSITLKIPTLSDILEARNRICKYIPKTELKYFPSLSKLLGAEVYIKFENQNPTNAFKVRGGVNLALKMKSKPKALLAGSTGNHGQSIAYAGKLLNIPVIIVCPENSNSLKVNAMRELGAEVILSGKDVSESWEYCEKLSSEKDYLYVHSVNQPELFEGVGTIGLEIYEDLPDIDCFITAVGGGSGICGSSIALKNLDPKIKTYAVQAEGASSIYDSFKQKRIVNHDSLSTFAEGLATRSTFEYSFKIMQDFVDDVFLVSDDEIKDSIRLIYKYTGSIAEGAGAASLSGLIKYKEKFQDKKVVCVLTGGNLQKEMFQEIVNSN